MKAFCIALLCAKAHWNENSLKFRKFDSFEVARESVVESQQSTKTCRQLDFVNTLAGLFKKRGKGSFPTWYSKCLEIILAPPLQAKHSDAGKTIVQIRYTGSWLQYDYRFYKINRKTKKYLAPIPNLWKFAAELEGTNDRWQNKLLTKYLSDIHTDKTDFVTTDESSDTPAKHTLEFYKEQFDDHLIKALKDIEEGPWWQLFQDNSHPNNKMAQLGERIGELQREKQGNRVPVRPEQLNGENDFVLESTHEVFFSANRDFPEIGRGFDSLIDALEVIDHASAGIHALKFDVSREEWMREIGRRFTQGRIYLFLLYFTYLEIEAPNAPRAVRSRELLKKNRFFSLLAGHGAGINSAFFGFHGTDLFCRDGEAFHNLYFQKYEVQIDDTLQSIIHKKYQNGHIDFAACLQGLVECHECLKDVPVTVKLLPILKPLGITAITIVPPGPRDNSYQRGVTEVQNWVKKRNQLEMKNNRKQKKKGDNNQD